MGIKHTVNENFFSKWTPNMAYVLGYIYADGNITDSRYNRGSYLNITSTDFCSIKNIRKALDSKHKIKIEKNTSESFSRKTRYLLHIGSNKIYESLKKRGLYPNKSLTVSLPEIPSQYFSHFVRGYFDGDGCVYIEKSEKKQPRRLRIIFTSGSKKFLISLERQIRKLWKTTVRGIYDSHRSFQLVYGSHDGYKIFKQIYLKNNGLYLPRKYSKFIKYFEPRKKKFGHVVK